MRIKNDHLLLLRSNVGINILFNETILGLIYYSDKKFCYELTTKTLQQVLHLHDGTMLYSYTVNQS